MAQVTISELNCPLTEVSVLTRKGSHTPDSCVPPKYLQLYEMNPHQDARKLGNLDLPAF